MKIQKPIDIDAHFKYRCPKCSSEHWLSLNEAKTNRFKIVCHCGKVFGPKRIKKLKILYLDIVGSETTSNKEKQKKQTQESTTIKKQQKEINSDLLDKCTKLLVLYGFTKSEAQDILKKAYDQEPIEDSGLLIKCALKLIGVHK